VDNKRPTWAEIDLAAIRNNLRCIKRRITSGTRIMAVVKADAYRHGLIEVSRICLDENVDYLAVATLDEAMELLNARMSVSIMVLGYIPGEYADLVVNYGIRATVYDYAWALKLSSSAQKLGKEAYIHIKIDTGMGRIGFAPNLETIEVVGKIAALPGIKIEGIFTHFAEADGENDKFTMEQLAEFQDFTAKLELKGIHIPIKHCANSAAAVRYPETHLDMVRVGIVLYGLYPSPGMKNIQMGIVPAMTLKSRVSMVKRLNPGHGISYRRTHICEKETRIATVPIGYADGYNRMLSNRAWAMIKGEKAYSLGVVCMDQCMFDISGREDIKEGDEVILFGKDDDGITADDLAEIANTVNYEIVCSVSSRVPRTYV